MSEFINNEYQQNSDGKFKLINELKKYLIHWKLFALGIVVSLAITFFKLRYITPRYQVQTTLLIKDQSKGLDSELSAFQDLDIFGVVKSNIQNEIQLLKSRDLLKSVAKELNLNISYFIKGNFKDTEVYNSQSPIKLIVADKDESFYTLDTVLNIRMLTPTKFAFLDSEGETIKEKEILKSFLIGGYSCKIDFKKIQELDAKLELRIHISNIKSVINNLVSSIKVSPIDNKSSVLKLTMTHGCRLKSKMVLNTLVNSYKSLGIDDKNEVGINTHKFVETRLKIIKNELAELDKIVENYKKQHNLTDIGNESISFLEKSSRSNDELFKLETQIKLIQFISNYLVSHKTNYELIPVNLGFEDSSISLLINKYNNLLLKRNKIIRNSSYNNPLVSNMDIELMSYKQSLEQSLISLKQSLKISSSQLVKEGIQIRNKIIALPTRENELKSLVRQQTIKEQLYLYLLEKQEETKISLAVTRSNSQVIDRAYGSSVPISPNKKSMLLTSFIIGVLIPFVFVYLKFFFDTKFHSREDVEAIVKAPILGCIPLSNSGDKVVVHKGSRTSSSEAFRLLRTNLNFTLANDIKKSKVIFVTSTIKGEGKTFVSVNTSCTLALSGKKVLLIEMDLRAPKVTNYLRENSCAGIVNYIADSENYSLENIILSSKHHKNLDILSSGIISLNSENRNYKKNTPPNPAELLLSPKIEELFKNIKDNYDYVVVDTAPVNLVTDTLILSNYADMFVYVTRANFLQKSLLQVPQKLYIEQRLPNIAVLINGLTYKEAYGYSGYGYSEIEVKKNIFKKISRYFFS